MAVYYRPNWSRIRVDRDHMCIDVKVSEAGVLFLFKCGTTTE